MDTDLRCLPVSCLFSVLMILAANTDAAALTPQTAVPISYQPFIADAAQRFAIPADWISAVMHVESNGNAAAVSPKGAIGLMQVMPETWRDLRLLHHFGPDPFDPHDNIFAGAAYLRMLYDRYGTAGFLAAYNAGPAHYDAYRLAGVPLARETQGYLVKLGRLLPNLKRDDPDMASLPAPRDAFLGSVSNRPTALPLTARQAASLQGIVASIVVLAAQTPRPDDP